MDWVYKKVLSWAIGEALAHSDRVKVAIYTALMSGLALVLPHCPFCASILTPDLMEKAAGGIVALGVTMIASVTKRDVAAPGEVVEGAAQPVPSSPPVDTRALRGDRP